MGQLALVSWKLGEHNCVLVRRYLGQIFYPVQALYWPQKELGGMRAASCRCQATRHAERTQGGHNEQVLPDGAHSTQGLAVRTRRGHWSRDGAPTSLNSQGAWPETWRRSPLFILCAGAWDSQACCSSASFLCFSQAFLDSFCSNLTQRGPGLGSSPAPPGPCEAVAGHLASPASGATVKVLAHTDAA